MKLRESSSSFSSKSVSLLFSLSVLLGGCGGGPNLATLQIRVPPGPQAAHQDAFALGKPFAFATAPSSVAGFNCVFANIMGSGIGDWTDNQTQVQAANGCGYFGDLSNLIPVSSGGIVTVDVVPGPQRYVQMLGAITSNACSGIPATTDLGSTTTYPGLFELGRTVADIYVDQSIQVSSAYNATTAVDARCAGTTTSGGTKQMYLVAVSNGNLGGISGADATCNANLPAGVTSAKAMLSYESTRRACTSANCQSGGASEHIDWVLAANATYTRTDGTVIGTTNSIGLLTFPLIHPVSPTTIDAYLGFTDTTSEPWVEASSNFCSGWSSSSGGAVGNAGAMGASDVTFDFTNDLTCNTAANILCVQQ
jgi:hypothetical protein